MSLKTKNYSLTAFTRGDLYSASSDKERFSIIDTQLSFLAETIGDGVSYGWLVSSEGSNSVDPFKITVSSGGGIIARRHTRTFGDLDITVPGLGLYSLYLQRKRNYLATFSGFSQIGSILYTDVTPPVVPSGLSASSPDYKTVNLSWNINSEVDFSHYKIKRSINGVLYTDINISFVNSYQDLDVDENTTYWYKISAVDMSGNESSDSLSVSVAVQQNMTAPNNPLAIMSIAGEDFIQAVWQAPAVGNVTSYNVELYILDENENILSLVDSVNTANLWYIIYNLELSRRYELRIYAKTVNAVLSSGYITRLTTYPNFGPEEVSNLVVSESQGISNTNNIKLSVNANINYSDYKEDTIKVIATIIENGNIISSPMEIFPPSNSGTFGSSVSFEFESYKIGNITRGIKPYTNYIIKVQCESISGNKNKGIIYSIKTSSFVSPKAPNNIVPTLQFNGDLLFSWTNSISKFSYNIINVIEIDELNNESFIENGLNIGKSSFYLIPRPLTSLYKYRIEIVAVDLPSGNQSPTASKTYIFEEIPQEDLNPPKNQFILNGDGCVLIGWQDIYPSISNSFSIWRADTDSPASSSDFVLIKTVPSTDSTYVDYTVENGTHYTYIITSDDIYGRKIKNPTDGNYFLQFLRAYPTSKETFTSVGSISVSISNSNDALISWSSSNDSFDGWEIYRSDDIISWTKVGSARKEETSFIDINALLVNGVTYRYMIRKYRDEAVLVLSQDDVPLDSILLANVDSTSGYAIIDYSAKDISDLSAFLLDYSVPKINEHKHSRNISSDNRILLSEATTVSQWKTANKKVFTTSQYISGALEYVVYINGSLTDLDYYVDQSNNSIVFAEEVDASSLVLECLGLREIDGSLPEKEMQNFSATVLGAGFLDKRVVPEINHDGRMKEKMVPLQLSMKTHDGYSWMIDSDKIDSIEEIIGTTVTFYDILSNIDNDIIAATSMGIIRTIDNGNSWNTVYDGENIAHKLLYVSSFTRYFALTDSGVLTGTSGSDWGKIQGFQDVASIRDIVFSSTDNSVFVSTNVGVYRVELISSNANYLYAVKMTDVSFKILNCYGIWINSFDSTLNVSTSYGIYSSADFGATWTLSGDFLSTDIIYSFAEDSGFVFCVSDSGVWRKNISSGVFERIGLFDIPPSRRIIILNSQIYVAMEDGLYMSELGHDIYNDSSIILTKKYAKIYGSRRRNCVYGLSFQNGNLYIGVDGYLYETTDGLQYLTTYTSNGVTPTFFANDKEVSCGFYFNRNKIYTDTRYDKICVSNQYKLFRAKNYGWLDQRYKANVKVYKNNWNIASFSNNVSLTNVINSFDSVDFSDLSLNNADFRDYQKFITNYNNSLAVLKSYKSGEYSLGEKETEISLVNNVSWSYDRVYSQSFKESKYYTLLVNTDYTIVDFEMVKTSLIDIYYPDFKMVSVLPRLLVSSTSAGTEDGNYIEYINVSDGVMSVADSFDKFDEIEISIESTSFNDFTNKSVTTISDDIEYKNSGLTFGMSEIQQSILVGSMLSIEREYPNEGTVRDNCEEVLVERRNVKTYNIADDFYDVINSTIDWTEEVSINSYKEEFSLIPTVVAKFGGYVVVGTIFGLYSISIATYELSKVDITNNNNNNNTSVFDIYIDNSTIYVVLEDGIYYSSDLIVWNVFQRKNLSGSVRKFLKFNENYIATTSNGIYMQSKNRNYWVKYSDLNKVTEIIFNGLLFAINDNILYYSSNGKTWTQNTDFSSVIINSMKPFLGQIFMSTNNGFRNDLSSFYSSNAQSSLLNVSGTITDTNTLPFNDVSVNDSLTEIVAFASNGRYFTTSDGNSWTTIDSGLKTIHKGLYVGSDIWAFGYDLLKVSSMSLPIELVIGDSI